MFTVFELFGDRLISWLPLYYEAKIAFVIWLTLPQFRGATILYNSVVQRYIVQYEPQIDRHIDETTRALQHHAGEMGRKSASGVQAVLFMLLQRVTEALSAVSRQQLQQAPRQQQLLAGLNGVEDSE